MKVKQKLNDINLNYNEIKNNYDIVIKENEQYKKKEKELNEKILNLSKFKEEFENIKNEFSDLEKEMLEKNTKIEVIEKSNEDLKNKLKDSENLIITRENYQKELEDKIDSLNQLCGKYENAYNGSFQDLEKTKKENETLKNELKEKTNQLEKLKNSFNQQLKILRYENFSLKKKENMYKQILTKLKNYSSGNIITQNNINQGLMNTSYYTYNTTKGNDLNISHSNKDESSRYSYQLIDNLKNVMSKVDLEYNS